MEQNTIAPDLREQAKELLRRIGLPEHLDLDVLIRAGSPLAPVARTALSLAVARVRRLSRLRTGAEALIGDLHAYVANTEQGRRPQPLNAEALLGLAREEGAVASLDEMLGRLVDALIEASGGSRASGGTRPS
ncbi:hypothetical protein [Micromonospora sp. WMMC273]|uniref:hypothetical protein n=1 Tax=Micromonospora sp. WMMC273 TaxID=3015157 RepID=UPI0022B6F867|nr:hypothetical protein [Micromonospora sp. WMMC273]MCZ7478847.1 hypothetical protein [Micromonospora sp. WMMC273]